MEVSTNKSLKKRGVKQAFKWEVFNHTDYNCQKYNSGFHRYQRQFLFDFETAVKSRTHVFIFIIVIVGYLAVFKHHSSFRFKMSVRQILEEYIYI